VSGSEGPPHGTAMSAKTPVLVLAAATRQFRSISEATFPSRDGWVTNVAIPRGADRRFCGQKSVRSLLDLASSLRIEPPSVR
jgi:hypothetical protein